MSKIALTGWIVEVTFFRSKISSSHAFVFISDKLDQQGPSLLVFSASSIRGGFHLLCGISISLQLREKINIYWIGGVEYNKPSNKTIFFYSHISPHSPTGMAGEPLHPATQGVTKPFNKPVFNMSLSRIFFTKFDSPKWKPLIPRSPSLVLLQKILRTL